MYRYGLLGRNISYSFSKGYFTKKFNTLGLEDHSYENFDMPTIDALPALLRATPDLQGLNVTIPYKEAVIPHLDKLHKKAKVIGAVNTIEFTKKGLKGYNTDCYGFKKSIKPMLKPHHTHALLLGTGGASKAVAHVFDELGINYKKVSRTPSDNDVYYHDLDHHLMKQYTVIVNCTPLGTHPNIENKPNIPYTHINDRHLLYDLIYNPAKTAFLKKGEARGATICNGLRMLELQAEKAWKIWNS